MSKFQFSVIIFFQHLPTFPELQSKSKAHTGDNSVNSSAGHVNIILLLELISKADRFLGQKIRQQMFYSFKTSCQVTAVRSRVSTRIRWRVKHTHPGSPGPAMWFFRHEGGSC